MADLLKVPIAEIATIGDMPSDVLMFAVSGFSIAMVMPARTYSAGPTESLGPIVKTVSRKPSRSTSWRTQNPIEQEGTYPLPEAQVDRFLLKVNVGYPTPDEELRILDAMATSAPRLDVRPVVSTDQILAARQVVNSIYVDEKIKRYIVSLVVATRDPRALGLHSLDGLIRYGASPRATIGITLAAKAWAFLRGRGYVTPQDVKAVAPDVLRHRVALTYEAEAERATADAIVASILDHIAIP